MFSDSIFSSSGYCKTTKQCESALMLVRNEKGRCTNLDLQEFPNLLDPTFELPRPLVFLLDSTDFLPQTFLLSVKSSTIPIDGFQTRSVLGVGDCEG